MEKRDFFQVDKTEPQDKNVVENVHQMIMQIWAIMIRYLLMMYIRYQSKFKNPLLSFTHAV